MSERKSTPKQPSQKSGPAKKEVLSKESSQQQESAEKTTKKDTPETKRPGNEDKTGPPAEKAHGHLVEVAENIEAGAGVVGEKVSDIAEKTAEVAGEVFKAVKRGLSSTYEAGAKVVDEITHTAQDYLEKYKHNIEVKKLSEERDKLTAKLGFTTFVKYKMSDAAPQKLLEEKEIQNLISEIEKLDKEIVKVGKELEKGK